MASILVTGGLGFIGSAFIRKAVRNGHEVLNLDSISYAANFENVADISGLENYDFVQGDVSDSVFVRQCLDEFQPDHIVHFAAETHVDRSIKSPIIFSQTNVLGTACLLDASCEYWRARGCPENFRFFHVSTDEVFGSIEKPYRSFETDAYRPNSPYSASKASSNHLVRAYHQTFGFPVLIGNASNTYGPLQHGEKLIPMILENAWNSSPITIYGDGQNVRDWLFVDDHIEAIFRVIEIGRVGSAYNIGSESEYTNNQIVTLVCDILMNERPNLGNCLNLVTYIHDRPGHDKRYSLDITKIRRDIGWSPSTDISDGLAKTVRFFISKKTEGN